MIRIALGAVSLVRVLASSDCAVEADLVELTQKARKSTVYLHYDATDSSTGERSSYTGSGFVVSSEGHLLTAYHVIKPWLRQTTPEQSKNRLYVRIGSIYGDQYEVQLVSFETDDAPGGADVALLKIRRPGTYEAAQCCYAARKAEGEQVISFGFPVAQELNHAKGHIANSDGPGAGWTANINFDHGMSGGPIYDGNGNVIGIVKGGLQSTDIVRYITPLLRAQTRLREMGIPTENCPVSQPAPLSPVPTGAPTYGERGLATITLGIKVGLDGDGQAVPSPCKDVAFKDYFASPAQDSIHTICE